MGILQKIFGKKKYRGQVVDFGVNKQGQFLAVLRVEEGNLYSLKQYLEKNNYYLEFKTKPIKQAEGTNANNPKRR